MRTNALLILAVLVSLPSLARAQDDAVPAVQLPGSQDDGAPPPPRHGRYATPLQQTEQSTYVPQSVALSGPRIIHDWEPGRPVPDGYHEETRRRGGLLAGGSVMFAVPYTISLIVAAAGQDNQQYTCSSGSGAYGGGCTHSNAFSSLFIPLVGPFVQMAGNNSSVGNLVLAMDGLLQAGGFAMLIAGIAAPKHVLVRNDLGAFSVAPLLAPGTAGMALSARF